MLYEFLPLIDEHNKARQSMLALEKVWLTQNCWFRVLTTFIGMAVVDLQRWDRSMRSRKQISALDDEDEDFTIREMADLIGRPLATGTMRYRETEQPSARTTLGKDDGRKLTRIRGEDGSIHYPSGSSISLSCYICRRYMERAKNTNWMCIKCGMPLCQKDRKHEHSGMTCLEEHLSSNHHFLGCGYMPRPTNKHHMPDHLKVWKQEEEATPAGKTPAKKAPSKKRKVVAEPTPSPPSKRITRASAKN